MPYTTQILRQALALVRESEQLVPNALHTQILRQALALVRDSEQLVPNALDRSAIEAGPSSGERQRAVGA